MYHVKARLHTHFKVIILTQNWEWRDNKKTLHNVCSKTTRCRRTDWCLKLTSETTVTYIVKKFHVFCKTTLFITVLDSAITTCDGKFGFIYITHDYLDVNLILSLHQNLLLPNYFLPLGLLNKMLLVHRKWSNVKKLLLEPLSKGRDQPEISLEHGFISHLQQGYGYLDLTLILIEVIKYHQYV
jgi:hypothetical protein